jgi:sugar lactone lactonase YvrE
MMMMTMTMKLASCTFLLFLSRTACAHKLATSSVRGLKTGGGSPEISSGGMAKIGLKMKMMMIAKKGAKSGKKAGMKMMMKAKKGEKSGKKAGMNAMGKMGSMKAGGKMMGNGGMKAKKGMEPKIIMESIDLGNRRPEGIASAAEAPYVYTSELFFGGIKKVNLETGEFEQIVEPYGYFARGAVGLKYYKGAIFAAGAGPQLGVPGLLYVYDSETGEEIAACAPPGISLFINDLVVYKGKVYVTDSGVNTIFVVDADAALKGECIVSSIELPEELFLDTTGQFLANGIVGYEGGLLLARSAGGLYYVDLNDESVREVVGTTNGDGLTLDGDTLYINEQMGFISVHKLSFKGGLVSVEFERNIMSDLFDTPTTSTLCGDYIVSVNARFGSLAIFGEEEGSPEYSEAFNVVSVDRFSE